MADGVRALSWGQLRDLGFDTADYVMGPLPQDSWLAKLDLKVWGKTPCLVCYFTSEDGKKFKLTAFPARHQGGREGGIPPEMAWLISPKRKSSLGNVFV